MWKIKSRQIILSLLLLCSVGATSSTAYNEYDWQRKDNENFEEWHRGQQQWRQWEAESNQPEQELLLPGILLGGLVLAGICGAVLLTKKSNKGSNIVNDNNSAEQEDYKVKNIQEQ